MAVRIREPLGERSAGLPLVVGGAGAGIVVPGTEDSLLQIEADARGWRARPLVADGVRLNGQPLREATSLDEGDVLGLADAQLVVHPAQATIDVAHLAGNATVAPLQREALPGEAVSPGVRQIFASGAAADPQAPGAARPTRRGLRWGLAAAGIVLALLGGLLFVLVPVPLQVAPADAQVDSDDLHWPAGERIFLLPGRRELLFSHQGYREQRLTLEVSSALADAAPLQVTLEKLPGRLAIDTGGVAAQLLVDGQAAGALPGEVELAAGEHELVIRAPRHLDHVARLQVEGGGTRQQLAVQLQSSIGMLALDTAPAGARISIDGEVVGTAPQQVELEAGLHRLAINAPGRRPWQGEVAIIAGQTLDLGRIDLALPPPVQLRPTAALADAQAAPAAPAAVVRTPPSPRLRSGLIGTLVLLPAGKYVQGSDRREQGRRANEVQREVTLTRAFYLADTEVTNAQFRAFRANHQSGVALDQSLDLDRQAVTNVSWVDAVEFCNWLSLREGLPAAYERRDGRWQLVEPRNTGFRLPTEAEWEYAARRGDAGMRRYAWGDALPPPARAANLAGMESLPKPGPEARLASTLPDYRDEHAVVAPVASYLPEAGGLHDLGGNVSEWMHDVYVSLPEALPVSDPMGAAGDGAHAVRGPNWRSAAIASLRLAWRERATGPGNTIGFRVARYAEELP